METTKQDTQTMTVTNNNELVDNISNQQPSFWRRFGTRAVVYTGVTALADAKKKPSEKEENIREEVPSKL